MNKVLIYSVFLMAILLCSCNRANTPPKKPNVIIILADDLGYAGLSSFGGEGISTPHLDKLANNGVKCTNFYANSTVCSPTRVALLSGRYQQRVGLDHIYFHCVDSIGFDPRTNPSLPLILKENGYKTGVFGKWHLGSGEAYQPKAHGFDDFVGFLDGNIDFISKHNTESEIDWFVHHEPSTEEGYVTHLLNDAVVNFIEKEKEHPFFIYLPEAAVHVPMQGPNDPPLRTDDFYTYKVDNKFPKDEYMRRYSEMVSAMDDGVGRIIEALEKNNLLENTLIIFTSDNGGEPTGVKYGKVNGDNRGHKVDMYEGGLKVPTLFYWKGKLEAKINDQVMLTMDLFPTIMDITKSSYTSEKRPDGVNLSASLFDNQALDPRDVFWMHRERLVYRNGDMKLIWQNKAQELYDLKNDPLESVNLINEPQYQELVYDMTLRGEQWHKNTAVGFPAGRKLGIRVSTTWPCTRDLESFNDNKAYYWENDRAIIK
ncbi:sulfatase-like hydrolase/transferase [Saccharicrinis aurantiacus]|uniref:sulfatase-like hydrolase/transferase n=1 Tax=Saccharicrinis aurantiacus TaxID=1849719 RepID=UPI0024926BFD|nr:sulfatase-like hydrolase/transferase [Saccharicrinis aurantiacus]